MSEAQDKAAADKAKAEADAKAAAEKAAADKAKAKPRLADEHEQPYPSQAECDDARLNMAKAGEYLTRVQTAGG